MAKAEQKTKQIIVAALDILATHGDKGLTMRQVAKQTQMSLSNVQYYFQNRDALLVGLIDFHLNESYVAYNEFLKTVTQKDRLVETIRFLLIDPDMSPVCRIFKELWAISERNETIKTHLNDHYRFYGQQLAQALGEIAPPDCPQENIDQAVSLILPMVEGYIVTREAIPLDEEALARFLAEQVLQLVGLRTSPPL